MIHSRSFTLRKRNGKKFRGILWSGKRITLGTHILKGIVIHNINLSICSMDKLWKRKLVMGNLFIDISKISRVTMRLSYFQYLIKTLNSQRQLMDDFSSFFYLLLTSSYWIERDSTIYNKILKHNFFLSLLQFFLWDY